MNPQDVIAEGNHPSREVKVLLYRDEYGSTYTVEEHSLVSNGDWAVRTVCTTGSRSLAEAVFAQLLTR